MHDWKKKLAQKDQSAANKMQDGNAGSAIWIGHQWSYRRNGWPRGCRHGPIQGSLTQIVQYRRTYWHTWRKWCDKKNEDIPEEVILTKLIKELSEIFHNIESTEDKMLKHFELAKKYDSSPRLREHGSSACCCCVTRRRQALFEQPLLINFFQRKHSNS